MQRLTHAIDLISRAGMTISRLALVGLLLTTVYAVVTRYVFNSASVHALEISTYLLSIITWLSIAAILREDRHVRMDALRERLSPGFVRIAQWISTSAILAFASVLCWAGSVNVLTALERGYRTSSLLAFPLWIVYLLIPIGAGLLVLMALRMQLTPAGDHSGVETTKN